MEHMNWTEKRYVDFDYNFFYKIAELGFLNWFGGIDGIGWIKFVLNDVSQGMSINILNFCASYPNFGREH